MADRPPTVRPGRTCPRCGGSVDEATTAPNTRGGRCDVYLVCEDCDWSTKVGVDWV